MQKKNSSNSRFSLILISILVIGWLVILGIKLHGRNAVLNEIIEDSLEYVDTYIAKGDYLGAKNMLNSIKETQTSKTNIRKLELKISEIENTENSEKKKLYDNSIDLLTSYDFKKEHSEYILGVLDKVKIYGVCEISDLVGCEDDLEEIYDPQNQSDDKYGIYYCKVITRRGSTQNIDLIYRRTKSQNLQIISIEFREKVIFDANTVEDIDEVLRKELELS